MRNRNGTGGISKLSGKRRRPFVARVTVGFTDEGVQIYKTLGYFATKLEAQAELVKYNKTKYNIDQKQKTFEQIYKDWSDSHYKDISEGSVRGYKSAYKHCKNIYDVRFSDLRAVHLQRVIDEDCKTYSVKKIVKVLLNVLYKYAMKNDIVDKKYSEFIELGKSVKVHDKQPFTDEEIQTLWNNVDNIEGVDTILILIYTCCRINEILKEIEDINFDDRWIKTGSKTESGKRTNCANF